MSVARPVLLIARLPRHVRPFSLRHRLRDSRTTPPPAPIAPRASPPKKNRGNQLPVYSLVAIFALGTIAFNVLIQQRAGQTPAHTYELPDRAPSSKDQWPHPTNRSPKDQ